MSSNRNLKEAVAKYLERGWKPIPLAPGKKNPYHENWTSRDFKLEDYGKDDNVGIRIVGGIVDVDLDNNESVVIASVFLPSTGAIFGRTAKPKSHWLYTCPEITEPEVYKDYKGVVMLEIRTGTDQETMIPPSIHPSGEEVTWHSEDDATVVEAKVLKRAVSLLGAASLIAQRYPPAGGRHEWALALSGTLKQLGVSREEAEKIFRGAALVAGDTKLDERLEEELYPTYNKADEDPMAGFRKLRDYDKELAEPIRRFLGDAISVKGFVAGQNGTIIAGKPENIERAVKRLKYSLRYDSFSNRKMLFQESNSENGLQVEDWHLNSLRIEIDKKFGFFPPKEGFCDVLDCVARQDPFNPVQEYLESLPAWDGKKRVDRWLIDLCGAEDTPYTQAVGRLPILAAVTRAFYPGAKFDELLVLESKQGSGKSTILKNLCPDPEWYSDDLPLGTEAKQIIERTEGKWIIEVAELFGLGKKEIDQVKAFLSRGEDGPVRGAYARESRAVKRSFICIGTTNKPEYLKDATGSRRFWPVTVANSIDADKMTRVRSQIWAEAYSRLGESIRLNKNLYSTAASEQQVREVNDPWQEALVEVFKDPPAHIQKRIKGVEHGGELRLVPGEAWDIIGVPMERRDARGSERLTNIFLRLGFKKVKIRRGKVTSYGWGRER